MSCSSLRTPSCFFLQRGVWDVISGCTNAPDRGVNLWGGLATSAEVSGTSGEVCEISGEIDSQRPLLEEPKGHPPKGHREEMKIQISY